MDRYIRIASKKCSAKLVHAQKTPFLTNGCSAHVHAPIWLKFFLLAILLYMSVLSLQSYFNRSLLICPKCQNHPSVCQVYVHDYFFETPKKQFFCILMQLLMLLLSWAYQKLHKTIETPHLKWILSELQPFVYKQIKKTNCCYLGVSPSHSCLGLNKAQAAPDW